MSPLSDEYYHSQLVETKVSWVVIMVIIMTTLITIVVIVATVRSRYSAFILDPRIGTSFAYMCAFGHVYPFLAPLFFKNPNTPDIVINTYYYLASFSVAPWGTGAPTSQPMEALVVPSNWRDAVGSITWYAESNAQYGYSQVLNWAQTEANLITQSPTSMTPSLVSELFSYGLPILNTLIMVVGLAL